MGAVPAAHPVSLFARKPPPLDLSVTVVAWNRARQLEGLIANVTPFAREVVVVDGGSQDDTEELCRAHPKVVYVQRPWDGHFGRQKNASFEAASGEWILHLDTDERVGPKLAARLPLRAASTTDRQSMRNVEPSSAIITAWNRAQASVPGTSLIQGGGSP